MSIRLGDRGSTVGQIQQDLIEAGYSVTAAEMSASEFGLSTDAAVRAFQLDHRLDADGIVGPLTADALSNPNLAGVTSRYAPAQWRCDPSEARAEVRRVIEVAAGEIGVREEPDGSNRGSRVDLYTAPNLGIPWCVAFLSWCFNRGCDEGSPFGRILSAWSFSEWAKTHKRTLGDAALPQPGDCFIILRADFHGHAGLIVGSLPDGRLCTIEGNAGNAVRGLIRQRSTLSMLVRPIPLT